MNTFAPPLHRWRLRTRLRRLEHGAGRAYGTLCRGLDRENLSARSARRPYLPFQC